MKRSEGRTKRKDLIEKEKDPGQGEKAKASSKRLRTWQTAAMGEANPILAQLCN